MGSDSRRGAKLTTSRGKGAEERLGVYLEGDREDTEHSLCLYSQHPSPGERRSSFLRGEGDR